MKRLFFICFISLIALACSDDEANNTAPADTTLIRKIAYSDGGISVVYTYNGTKMVSAVIDNSHRLEYIYEGDLVTRINSYGPGDQLTNYFIHEYENGRLTATTQII